MVFPKSENKLDKRPNKHRSPPSVLNKHTSWTTEEEELFWRWTVNEIFLADLYGITLKPGIRHSARATFKINDIPGVKERTNDAFRQKYIQMEKSRKELVHNTVMFIVEQAMAISSGDRLVSVKFSPKPTSEIKDIGTQVQIKTGEGATMRKRASPKVVTIHDDSSPVKVKRKNGDPSQASKIRRKEIDESSSSPSKAIPKVKVNIIYKS